MDQKGNVTWITPECHTAVWAAIGPTNEANMYKPNRCAIAGPTLVVAEATWREILTFNEEVQRDAASA